jgi:hypothetical protein
LISQTVSDNAEPQIVTSTPTERALLERMRANRETFEFISEEERQLGRQAIEKLAALSVDKAQAESFEATQLLLELCYGTTA